MRPALAAAAVAVALAGCADGATLASASCADHPDQASAQRAADTTDGDGDGVYCETLPCPCAERAAPAAAGRGERSRARVEEVVDGDTLAVRVDGSRRTVRLIGIDTPETRKPGAPVECGGPAATAHLKRIAPPGRAVTLTADPTQDAEDRYGRVLAYVDDLAERQLAAGHAKVYVFERPFQRVRRFRAAERRARAAARGAWGACGADF